MDRVNRGILTLVGLFPLLLLAAPLAEGVFVNQSQPLGSGGAV